MDRPNLLCVASSVDFASREVCTPAWWQLWKGLHDEGTDLVIAPYRGGAVETVWWRSAPNPLYRGGDASLRAAQAWFGGGGRRGRRGDLARRSVGGRLAREAIARLVTARWARYLERLVEQERPDAVVFFNVPVAHFRGIPAALRDRFGVPVVFFDGNAPMSLPEFAGTGGGLNPYDDAAAGEYDLVVSTSEGALARLVELGARRAEVVFWAVDPQLFSPRNVEKETDVFFYGRGDAFRGEWMEALVGEPSRALPLADFSLGGHCVSGDASGASRRLREVPFSMLPRAISAARINLCITRIPTATTYASSSCRPFELAASAAAIVANPYEGIEPWFEPGRELLVVRDAQEAISAYTGLLDDPAQAEEMGRLARERVLDEHTYRHRARRLLELVGLEGRSEGRRRRPTP
jgi:hypothetical protein